MISDVEVHEISEPSAKGWYTATVSLTANRDGQRVRAKLRVTYKMQSSKNKDGLEGWTYPIGKLSTVSVKHLEDAPQ